MEKRERKCATCEHGKHGHCDWLYNSDLPDWMKVRLGKLFDTEPDVTKWKVDDCSAWKAMAR